MKQNLDFSLSMNDILFQLNDQGGMKSKHLMGVFPFSFLTSINVCVK